MGRLILGIVAGIAAAFATVWGIDLIGHMIHPVPSDLDANDYEAIGAYIRTMPPLALAIVVLAWFAGALVGGLVAAVISRRRWTIWLIALLVVGGALLNVLMIPHPVLLQIGAVAAPLLGGLAAQAILARRRSGPGAGETMV